MKFFTRLFTRQNTQEKSTAPSDEEIRARFIAHGGEDHHLMTGVGGSGKTVIPQEEMPQ